MSMRSALARAFVLLVATPLVISAQSPVAPSAKPTREVKNPAATVMMPAKESQRIGIVQGDDHYQFFRVAAVHINQAGEYHVGMEFDVRVFDRNGKYLKTIGRHGKGPGEFNYAPQLWFARDTMVAIDRNLMRASTFNAKGDLIATYNEWSNPHRTIHPIGRVSNAWIAAVDLDGKDDQMDALPPDVRGIKLAPGQVGERGPIELRRYFPKNDSIGPIIVAAHNQKLVGVEVTKENPIGITIRPLDDEPAYAVDDRGFVYAKMPNEYRIDVYDGTGKPQFSIRRDYTPVPISVADFDGLPQLMADNMSKSMTVQSGTMEAAQARMLQSLNRQVDAMRKMPLPPTRYPVGRLLVSPGGTLWAERADYMKPAVRQAMKSGPNRVATRWDIFDPAGRYVGTTDLPLGFRPMSVTDDGRVAGVFKDEDDVEFVVVYKPQRGPRG